MSSSTNPSMVTFVVTYQGSDHRLALDRAQCTWTEFTTLLHASLNVPEKLQSEMSLFYLDQAQDKHKIDDAAAFDTVLAAQPALVRLYYVDGIDASMMEWVFAPEHVESTRAASPTPSAPADAASEAPNDTSSGSYASLYAQLGELMDKHATLINSQPHLSLFMSRFSSVYITSPDLEILATADEWLTNYAAPPMSYHPKLDRMAFFSSVPGNLMEYMMQSAPFGGRGGFGRHRHGHHHGPHHGPHHHGPPQPGMMRPPFPFGPFAGFGRHHHPGFGPAANDDEKTTPHDAPSTSSTVPPPPAPPSFGGFPMHHMYGHWANKCQRKMAKYQERVEKCERRREARESRHAHHHHRHGGKHKHCRSNSTSSDTTSSSSSSSSSDSDNEMQQKYNKMLNHPKYERVFWKGAAKAYHHGFHAPPHPPHSPHHGGKHGHHHHPHHPHHGGHPPMMHPFHAWGFGRGKHHHQAHAFPPPPDYLEESFGHMKLQDEKKA
ncbi:hypothetical protein BC940DRAFT_310901 [Gongronella butleri]|nr:hypothetical protein BC940DRAFT_310901 [Gongronella butleri]